MLELYKQIVEKVDSLRAAFKFHQEVLDKKMSDSMHIVEINSNTCFDLNKITDKQRLYMWSLLASRSLGAKLSEDEDLMKMCQDQIDQVKLYSATLEPCKNTEEELDEYVNLLFEAERLLSPEDKQTLFKEKAESIIKKM